MTPPADVVDILLVNGTVGAGKTSVAFAIGLLLEAGAVSHAVVDLDSVRHAWPSPVGDRFNSRLANRNLAALVVNFGAAGAELVVVAGVIEDAQQRDHLVELLDGEFWSCLLTVGATENQRRLRVRHTNEPDELDWYRRRAPELAGILAVSGLDDALVDTTGSTVEEVATKVLSMFRSRNAPNKSVV